MAKQEDIDADLSKSEHAEVAIIILLLTYVVGLGQLTHIIAGSAETLYLVGIGHISFGTYLGSYMVPTLIGNILGGVSIAAAINHAQAVAGATERSAPTPICPRAIACGRCADVAWASSP